MGLRLSDGLRLAYAKRYGTVRYSTGTVPYFIACTYCIKYEIHFHQTISVDIRDMLDELSGACDTEDLSIMGCQKALIRVDWDCSKESGKLQELKDAEKA
jgi:hypothetical protein